MGGRNSSGGAITLRKYDKIGKGEFLLLGRFASLSRFARPAQAVQHACIPLLFDRKS